MIDSSSGVFVDVDEWKKVTAAFAMSAIKKKSCFPANERASFNSATTFDGSFESPL